MKKRRIKKEHIHEGLFFFRYLLLLLTFGLSIALAYFSLYILPRYENRYMAESTINSSQAVPILKPIMDTSMWMKYKNGKYNFEFKYPAEWGVPTVKPVFVTYTASSKGNTPTNTLTGVRLSFTQSAKDGCVGASECGLTMTFNRYSTSTPLLLSCGGMTCDPMNLLTERSLINRSSNIKIGSIPAIVANYKYDPTSSLYREYRLFTGDLHAIVTGYFVPVDNVPMGLKPFMNQVATVVSTLTFSTR